jgi:uncharacterized protein (TIGR02118 family)
MRMVVMIVCIRRKAGMTREAFSRHWRDVHGPLVTGVPEFMRHVLAYRQYHFCDEKDLPFQMFGDLSSYDGVALMRFESAQAIQAALAEPRYLEVIRPDEGNFIDARGCMTFVTDEVVMHAGDGAGSALSG